MFKVNFKFQQRENRFCIIFLNINITKFKYGSVTCKFLRNSFNEDWWFEYYYFLNKICRFLYKEFSLLNILANVYEKKNLRLK